MTFVLVMVLVGYDRYPTATFQEFGSKVSCEAAKELIRETTQLKVDVLKCVPK